MNLVRCPTCHREFSWDSAASSRPFCSNRCKLIDLGAWASERHAIPDDAATDNGDDRAPSNQDNESDFE